jgi:hypothetical protein
MIAVKQPPRLFVRKKKVVLREDFMELTKDINQALVLSQMLYWTKKIDNLNDMILEENKRLAEHGQPQIEYFHGWIWKSARQMKEELFHALSEDAIQRAFVALADKGIFIKRRNPNFKYDRTLQYRIDLVLLRRMLKDIGVEFTDFQLDSIPHSAGSITRIAELNPPSAETIPEITIENTTETNPLTPFQKGEVGSSAMASHPTNGELNFFSPDQITADAKASEASASKERPPTNDKPTTRRVAKKLPPIEKPTGISTQVWDDFIALRNAKRAPLSTTAMAAITKEAESAGMSLEDALTECVVRGWRGFKAEWIKGNKPKPQATRFADF